VKESQKWRHAEAHTWYRANWEFWKSTWEIHKVFNLVLHILMLLFLWC